MRLIPLLLCGLVSGAPLFPGACAAVRISEFLASNSRTLADEDGEFSDWVELHNDGPAAVNLDGWFLTDTAARLAKWSFPATNLAAGRHLVVFASEKDRREPGRPLHTNFKLSADGEFLALLDAGTNLVSAFAPSYAPQVMDVSYGLGAAVTAVTLVSATTPARVLVPSDDALGLDWIHPDFDDAPWTTGTAALGYETSPAEYAPIIRTDVRAAMAGRNGSCYLRVPFLVAALTEFSGWKLRVQYDDGFIVWLNGEKIASRNAPDAPAWNSFASTDHPDAEAVVPEEFDLTPFRDRFVTGTNWLAVQGLNVSLNSSDFLLALTLEASRQSTGTLGARYFTTPTPGQANSGGEDKLGPLILVVKHAPAQPAFNEPLFVSASVLPAFGPVASVTLRYRVAFGTEVSIPMLDDGAHHDGTAGDGVFGATLPGGPAVGQMIRYRVMATDAAGAESRLPRFLDPLDSEQFFGTVVAGAALETRLPVAHLFVQNTGAADTRTGTRAALFYGGEFYENIKISLHGQSTASFPKKSYNVDFNRDHRFRYRTNEARVKDINLLTNWADKSRVRNTLAYEMIQEAGSIGHFAFPIRVHRNGQFFAVLDLVEDGDDRWLERVGLDPNGALYKMYNSLTSASGNEKKTRQAENTSDLQTLVTNLVESRPLSARVLYAYDNLDLPQVISYLAALALISSEDHGHKNYYLYRDTEGTGEWSLLPWDVDLSFGRNWVSGPGYFLDTLFQDNGLAVGVQNRLYSLIFNHPDFRRMYLRRLRTLMDGLLKPMGTPANALPMETRIRELLDVLDPPAFAQSDADLDYARWGSWGNLNQTRAEAQRILDLHLPGRRSFLFTNAAATLNGERIPTPQPANATVTIGEIDFNPVTGNQQEEYIQLLNPASFAVDVSGWELSGGIRHVFRPGTVIPANGRLYVTPNVNAFRARTVGPRRGQGLFIQGNFDGQLSAWGETLTLTADDGRLVSTKTYAGQPTAAQRQLRVTEIMFNPAPLAGVPDTQDLEFLELKNIGSTALNLAGVRFTQGVSFAFTNATASLLPPGGFVILARNRTAFAARYGTSLPVVGEYSGHLDNGGESLRLEDTVGEKILEFAFDPRWQTLADGQGRSLVITTEKAPWSEWGQISQWHSSATMGGSPGRDDVASSGPDADADGMADAWELAHQLNPQENDAAEDADADGLTNYQEYAAGTDPRAASSALWLRATLTGSGEIRFMLPTVAGQNYRLLFKTDLSDPLWTEVFQISATDPSEIKTVQNPVASRSGYYRLETFR